MKKMITTALALVLALTAFTGSTHVLAQEIYESSASDNNGERIYCVGSVSKVYVTAAVMQLVDQGLVELDAPITTYIPDFTMADPRYTEITVRMLMDHTSGIPGTVSRDMGTYADNDITGHFDILLDVLSGQTLKANPGEYACYCNDGFELLALIAQNVSGINYTDYVTENIASPLGLSHTGTAANADMLGTKASVYSSGIPCDYEYCMALGAGGVYATASDMALFGSYFFKGNESLISSELKDEMATRWTDSEDDYYDVSGLGWDYVENLAYERAGVSVIGKGGDFNNMHAHLLIAPDNEVSVSVLSSGGSSLYNGLMAQAILDVVLEDQGITIEHPGAKEVEILDTVPEEFEQYAGFYSVSDVAGTGLGRVSFDAGSMLLEVTEVDGNVTETTFRPTTSGGFVEVDDNGLIRMDQQVIFFEQGEDGKEYIVSEQYNDIPEIGSHTTRMYIGECLKDNPVSDKVQTAWDKYSEVPFVLYNNRACSTAYDDSFAFIKTFDELPGYLLVGTPLGSRLLHIEDEMTAAAFQTQPCSSNRDLVDVHISPDGALDLTDGASYIRLTAVPEFTSDIKEVKLKDNNASWYRIGDDMAYGMITVEHSEDCEIYVYNKFFETVYTTHYTGASDSIDLPVGGYIVFLGHTGETVRIR